MEDESKEVERMLGEYSDAVAIHGLGSKEAENVRRKYVSNKEFICLANTLDKVKCALSSEE